MDDLTEISNKFDDVKNIRNKITISFNEINAKIASLKLIYKDVSEKHNQPECTLGVDSLYFQNELITREFKNLEQLFDFINNRIYCEYYKLNSMIQHYIKDELRSSELIKKTKTETVYPPYKSLEPLKVYDFSLVIQLFNQISDLLSKMHSHTKNQDDNLVVDQGRMDMGLNIDNVIHSQTYVNTILREKGKMFKSYLSAFQRHHLKYLNRLDAKVELVLSIIHDDISLGAGKTTSGPKPSAKPRAEPNAEPSAKPRAEPNAKPRAEPSAEPNSEPNAKPRAEPSAEPNAKTDSEKEKGSNKKYNDTTSESMAEEIVRDVIEDVVSKIENMGKEKNNIEVKITE